MDEPDLVKRREKLSKWVARANKRAVVPISRLRSVSVRLAKQAARGEEPDIAGIFWIETWPFLEQRYKAVFSELTERGTINPDLLELHKQEQLVVTQQTWPTELVKPARENTRECYDVLMASLFISRDIENFVVASTRFIEARAALDALNHLDQPFQLENGFPVQIDSNART